MKINGFGQAEILKPEEISLLFSEGFVKERDRALFGVCLYTGARLDYKPIIHIKAISKNSNPIKIVSEILKYQVKESDLIIDREWFLELTKQLHKTRAVAVGGILRSYIEPI